MPLSDDIIRRRLAEMTRGKDHEFLASRIFAELLNYPTALAPLPRARWKSDVAGLVKDGRILNAAGNFKIVYCQIEHLRKGDERPIIKAIRHDTTYFLTVFTNRDRSEWEFVNGKVVAGQTEPVLRFLRLRDDDRHHTAAQILQAVEWKDRASSVELQSVHDDAVNVETITKEFFQQIANWYFWAIQHVRFPVPDGVADKDSYKAQSVIRLITRLMFCWFTKEKGLIPDHLFDSAKIQPLLTDPNPKHSAYYKAILQNLFFATLNQEMDKREFRKDGQNFMAHNLFRYKSLFQKPADALKLFSSIPFLNGGLFECLDKIVGSKEKPDYIRVDGFSDREDNPLSVPDFLFFGDEREADLSDAYGEARYNRAKVRGLIHTFNRYNFTVNESTPLDEEVALDPELLGKVFENLLAAYNPETGVTARKQTGSFYTPRPIVNYMVDESLIAYLAGKLATENTETTEKAANSKSEIENPKSEITPRLRHLFAYHDEPHHFSPAEVSVLIEAIDGVKILDPACGSGAFPMGIFHKLVFVLRKLDPHNQQWKQKQIEKAREIPDVTVREKVVADIERAFEGNEQRNSDTDTSALEDKIDRHVYALYGLSEEEIAIVEGKK